MTWIYPILALYPQEQIMKYDLGQGNKLAIEDQRRVQLDYKKVEIKDIDRIENCTVKVIATRRYYPCRKCHTIWAAA